VYRKQVRRRRAVLALLIIGSFALLTVTYGQGSDAVQRTVSSIFSPLQEVASRGLKPARDLVNWFDATFDARGLNSRLEAELKKARTQAVGGQAARAQNAQLRKLLGLDHSVVPADDKPVTGEVIARSPSLWYSTVTIDIGSGEGLAVNDPVIDGDGLVGRVAAVTGGSAQVTLISDHSSAVSAKVVPQGVQGIARAEVGDPGELTLDFIDSNRLVHRGETVVTAGWRAQGLASLFPPNLPIGEVTQTSIVEQEANQQVHVRPYADLRDLETVQALTGGWRG
jgi:rod shape-determining protein MreC